MVSTNMILCFENKEAQRGKVYNLWNQIKREEKRKEESKESKTLMGKSFACQALGPVLGSVIQRT